MKKGTDNYEGEKFILSFNLKNRNEIGCTSQEIVSLESLSKLIGSSKPIAIDNGAMITILTETLNEFRKLEKENKQLLKRNQMILVTPGDKLWNEVDKLQKEIDILKEQGKTIFI